MNAKDVVGFSGMRLFMTVLPAVLAGVLVYFSCGQVLGGASLDNHYQVLVKVIGIAAGVSTTVFTTLVLADVPLQSSRYRRRLQVTVSIGSALVLSSTFIVISVVVKQIDLIKTTTYVDSPSREWTRVDLTSLPPSEMLSSGETDSSPTCFTILGERRKVLFAAPPSTLSFSISIPRNARLAFGVALAPETWHYGMGDGVEFDVIIDDRHTQWHAFSTYYDPKNVPEHRSWHDDSINLSPWAGQTVTITLATGPGPNGDDRYDWAGWGEPRIVQPIAYDFLAELPNADPGGAGEEQVRQDTLSIDYESRAILFQHPANQVTYRLEIPSEAGLHFGLALDPAVWSPDNGDGVEYNIYVRDPDEPYVLRRAYHRYIDPKSNADDRRWVDEVVDLSAYGGQTVDLIFEALPGPAGDASFDWGGWSTPILVADDMAILNPPPPIVGDP